MSTRIKKRLLFIIAILGASFRLSAQDTLLEHYIREAFSRNQGLQQRNFQLDKSLYALQEAKSLFYPSVSLIGDYTRADGGRTIDIPIGDLLNNVYSSLNQLTGTNNFPQLKNQSVLLNPDNFYDAKLHTTLPLINTEIWYANKIRKENISLQQASVNVYKRKLVKDLKTAYYQYYQSCRAVEIYNAAMLLVDENIRVNKSFIANGVTNTTALTRSQAEQQKIITNITSAENQRTLAKAYFNFLLNKPLSDTILLDSTTFATASLLPVADTGTITKREELTQLEQQKKIATLQYKSSSSYMVPKLSTFLDLGSQGFNWAVDNKSRYYLWGVHLQWDIFTAGQQKHKAQQAAMDIKTADAAYSETYSALQFALTTAYNNYHTAVANYHNAQTQLGLSEKYYRDQFKVYKAGQLLYLELLDAQNQLTNARLQVALAFAGVQTSMADIELQAAAYQLQ
jgi:outer membrane protein TolC